MYDLLSFLKRLRDREAKFNPFVLLEEHEGEYRGRPGFSRFRGNPDDFAKLLSVGWKALWRQNRDIF